MWQPSEVKTASPKSSVAELARSAPASAVRPPISGPSLGDLERALRADRQPQLADLARQREQADRQHGDAGQRERRARAPATPRWSARGGRAAAAPRRRPPAARRGRPTPGRRGPWPRSTRTARRRGPAAARAPCAAQKTANSTAVAQAAPSAPASEADGEPGLDRAQRGPGHARPAARRGSRRSRAPRARRGRTPASCPAETSRTRARARESATASTGAREPSA